MFKQVTLALGVGAALLASGAAFAAKGDAQFRSMKAHVVPVGSQVTPRGTEQTVLVDIGGHVTNGECGYPGTNPVNETLQLQLPAGAVMIGVGGGADAGSITAYSPSWLVEIAVQFIGAIPDEQIYLNGFVATESSGTESYTVPTALYFEDFELPNITTEDGLLTLEFCESWDDEFSPQGSFAEGSTLTIRYLGDPLPSGEAEFGFSTGSINFGDVNVGSNAAQSVTVTNYGDAPGNLPSLQTTGAGFAVSGGSCTAGMELEADETCTVQVTFAPAAAGPASGELAFGGAQTLRGFPTTVALSGNGVAGGPGPGGGAEPVVANVPASNPWTLGLLAGALGLMGFGLMRRRG